MPYLYAVAVLAHRYRYALEVRCAVCCVVAGSHHEAMDKGRAQLLDQEDIHPDDGWTIVTTKACAPGPEEVLAVAAAIRDQQRALVQRLSRKASPPTTTEEVLFQWNRGQEAETAEDLDETDPTIIAWRAEKAEMYRRDALGLHEYPEDVPEEEAST